MLTYWTTCIEFLTMRLTYISLEQGTRCTSKMPTKTYIKTEIGSRFLCKKIRNTYFEICICKKIYNFLICLSMKH